jgi:ATPase subunit of ABC transporter with duplicated ATPase domains
LYETAARAGTAGGRGIRDLQVRKQLSRLYIFHEETRFPETEKISPPVLQLNEVSFGYTPEKILLKGANIDVGLDSRIAIVGANGAGKSTLLV